MRLAALVAAALFLAACQQEPAPVPVLRITERAQAPNLNAGLSTEAFLAGAARVEVQGYPDRPRFSVLARTPAIEKYPCATCHTVPLEKMRGPAGSPRRAHWGVTLKHAPASYGEIAESRDYNWPLSALPPGVLAGFDLPDCYRVLKAKDLKLLEPLGARGRT